MVRGLCIFFQLLAVFVAGPTFAFVLVLTAGGAGSAGNDGVQIWCMVHLLVFSGGLFLVLPEVAFVWILIILFAWRRDVKDRANNPDQASNRTVVVATCIPYLQMIVFLIGMFFLP